MGHMEDRHDPDSRATPDRRDPRVSGIQYVREGAEAPDWLDLDEHWRGGVGGSSSNRCSLTTANG
jgi:hypothetical protein